MRFPPNYAAKQTVSFERSANVIKLRENLCRFLVLENVQGIPTLPKRTSIIRIKFKFNTSFYSIKYTKFLTRAKLNQA